jgi:hypothetical protein
VLASALLLQTAVADTVIMRNGDRITCKVVRQAGSELVIQTGYAGTIRLDWAQVSKVRLDEPAAVLLDDDRVVAVAAIARDNESLRLDTTTAREPMTVSADQVSVVDPEPWETGRGGELSGRVGLALEDDSGNSEIRTSRIGGRACFRTTSSLCWETGWSSTCTGWASPR